MILERTNRLLPPIASAFDTLGIPYLFENAGLLSTREGAVILAGLRMVADRSDSLAAATMLHLLSDPEQDTPDWISERLQALAESQANGEDGTSSGFNAPWKDDPRFTRIDTIERNVLSPTLVAQQVIEALDLPTLVQKWGDPARRCSNLDSLLRHTREYEESAFDGGHAATLSGLILHLEQLASEELDILMTYHSAKGLEWPVVVLSGLNSDRSADMWSPVVTGGGQSDAGPLEGRLLRSWTWPFGMTDARPPKRRTGSDLDDDALTSPEGQEQTDRETNENLRLLYVGCTRAKHKLVFAHRAGKSVWLDRLPKVNSLLDSNLKEGEHGLEGIDTTLVLRRLNADMIEDCRIPAKQQERWLSLTGELQPSDLSPRFHSPSQESAESENATFHTEELAGSSHFPLGADESQYAAIGDAVHSYLAALPSIRSLDDAAKERVAERCLAAFSVTGILSPPVLVSSGERFCQWVDAQYPNALWHVEIPASGGRSAGGDWSGTIDLVLQLPTGEVVVIDHKSAPIRREHCEAKAEQFAGQLTAYSELLTSAGETVQSTWIHFPLAGVVVRSE